MAPETPSVTGLSPTEAATLRQDLADLSRDPFRARLAEWLDAPHDRDAFAAWLKKAPDRWAQGLAILARLSGYSEKLEVQHSGSIAALVLELQGLSDAQLEARQTERLKALGSGVTLSPATSEGKGSVSIPPEHATLATGLT